MELGLIGHGRMGASMSQRWLRAGHSVSAAASPVSSADTA